MLLHTLQMRGYGLNKLKLPSMRLGSSADIQIRIETDEIVFALIASISRSAPARVVTQAAWAAFDGWRVSVVDKGMTSINDVRLNSVSVVDATTVDLDGVKQLHGDVPTYR